MTSPTPQGSQDDTCSVADCQNSLRAKGMCVKHYYMWRRRGTPTPEFHGNYKHLTKIKESQDD